MNKTIYELTSEVLIELETLGHSQLTRDTFRYFWNGMIRYFESRGVSEFNIDIAMEYFEVRCAHKQFPKRTVNFINRALCILEYYNLHGAIPLRCKKTVSKLQNPNTVALLNRYSHQLNEGEYSNRTIDGYLKNVAKFLLFVEEKECFDANDWSAEIIFEYISTLSHFKKTTIKHHTGSIRLFLKYLYLEESTATDLSVFVRAVRGTYHQKLPSYWTKNEVAQMLAVIDRNNPNEKRDYAMILLVARLGLRSSDVKKLKFENMNWKENQITILQSKTGEPLTLPLLRDVGWAIIDYVQNARPNSQNPYIFLKHVAPYTEFAEGNHLYDIVSKYMLRAKLPIAAKRKTGMHSLRHSLATTLLEENIPLHEISDILGHTSTDSTTIYLNTNVERLRECSIDISGLEVT